MSKAFTKESESEDDEDLPDESKADEIYPATFDLLDIQSPV